MSNLLAGKLSATLAISIRANDKAFGMPVLRPAIRFGVFAASLVLAACGGQATGSANADDPEFTDVDDAFTLNALNSVTNDESDSFDNFLGFFNSTQSPASVDSSVQSPQSSASTDWSYQQINGYVVIEAEDFDSSTPSPTHQWQSVASVSASAASVMQALPDTGGVFDDSNDSPMLSYQVRFSRSGEHRIWIRGHSRDATQGNSPGGGGSDSVHVGLNGVLAAEARTFHSFPLR